MIGRQRRPCDGRQGIHYEGHSIVTPADLKKAILSNWGIDGVRVTVVPVLKSTDMNSTTNRGHD